MIVTTVSSIVELFYGILLKISSKVFHFITKICVLLFIALDCGIIIVVVLIVKLLILDICDNNRLLC